MRPGFMALLTAVLMCAPPALAEPTLPLQHTGRWITDAEGRVVVLHGYNMVYKRPPYAPDAIGFGEDDARFLASEGYNTVRVGIIYAAVEPQPGVYDDAYLARIQATVNMLARHGIVSLLDFHQDLYNERFQGEGWPDWAVIDDGLPPQPQVGFPGNYVVMPALWRAFDHFWANDAGPGGVGLQDRYAAAWRHVARRFRNHPYVMGYDLLNEPWPGSTWQTCANTEGCPVFDATLSEFTARMVDAIRTVDEDTMVFYEPNVIFNDGAKTNVVPPDDPQLGFSFHDYCLTAGETDTNDGCDFFDDTVFTNAETHSETTGSALLLTEFGATDARSINEAMTARADRFMVSWQEWHYCACDDPTTVGPGDKQAVVRDPRKPPEGDNLLPDKLAVFTRPYPQLVSGTPTSWDYDLAEKRFSLTYGIEEPTLTLVEEELGATSFTSSAGQVFNAGSITEIVVPKRAFPNAYAVQTEGAEVVSRPGAALLRVASCRGVESIRVTVLATGSSSSTCRAPRRLPALRVSVSPRRVKAGRRTRLRVRVRVASTGRALSRARVTVPGARSRRTDGRGEVRVRVRYRRPSRRRVVVRAAGYRSASATVRVVRR